MDISGLTWEELLELRKKVANAIKEKEEADRQNAIAKVNSLLAQVNDLQEKYQIEIQAFADDESFWISASEFSVRD